ncbi:competence type IV pilus minor pilin ComGD [Falsibacillus albus]|nr:competence type IV pilus minor pilin ComGD [Falsibacillus albus]
MIRNEDGFTLVESLIVMTILMIIMLVGSANMKKMNDEVGKNLFFSQLKADLFYSEVYAQSRKEAVVISFFPNNDQYTAISVNRNLYLFERKLPKFVDMKDSNLTSFMIDPQGNTNRFGTVNFQAQNKYYRLTVYIGRGRFIVR